jgi:hypothetical protein
MTGIETAGGRIRGAGRDALKGTVRWSGVATSQFRPPPDFLIIGAKRGGTTSFYFDLLAHPSVLPLSPPPIPGLKSQATKGVHYFDSNFARGERWYRSCMPTAATRRWASRRGGSPVVAGEASPFYLFHPAAAERAHAAVPEARIIALLRDPVLRTYSHWKERRRNGMEELDFLAALDAEEPRTRGERQRLMQDPHYTSYAWEQQSYAAQSRYAESLRPWIERFGRERVFVAASEEYYANPHDFLGLPRRATSHGAVRNAANGADLDPGTRRELSQRFAAANHALEELVGHPFPWT